MRTAIRRLLSVPMPRRLPCAAMMAGMTVLAGCTTGTYFSGSQLAALQPGRSTISDAVIELHAVPQQVLPQSDGSTIALWDFKWSLVTDAIYTRRQAILQFGPDGRLARVLDTTGVPLGGDTRRRMIGAVSPPEESAASGVPVEVPADGAAAQSPTTGATVFSLPTP